MMYYCDVNDWYLLRFKRNVESHTNEMDLSPAILECNSTTIKLIKLPEYL